MAVNLIKKSKNENEEEERKQILAQIQENSMARKNADIQTVKNAKVNWVNPNASTWQKMGWVARNTGNSAVKSVLDTIGAPMQSLAVGFNRGANQASRERTTYDKIGNAVTNYLATTPTMLGTAIRAKRFWDRNWDTAYQTAQNIEQAKGIGKVGAYLGGVTSAVLQETNPVMQSLYSGSQFYGQLAGEQGARKATEALLSADEKIHEKNDKKAQELAKEGSLYGGITQKAGEVAQTIGYMTPSIAISAITGGSSTGQAIGLVQMGLGSKGQTTRETLKNTGNIEMSERKGVASGTAESSSELMFSGLKAFKPFKANGFEDTAKKWISDAVEKRISSGLGQKALKTMGDWFVDVAGESVEELTTDIYNTWLDQSTTDPNKEYTLEDAVNTIFSTMLSTTALNAGYSGINNVVNNIYNRNQSKVENKESITDEERKATDDYKISIQAMVNNTDIPQEIKDQLQPMLNSNATINENEYNELKESIKKMVDVNTQRQYDELKNNVSAQYDQIDAQIEQLDEIKPENFQDAESRKYYAQQMGKEFDTSTFEQLLATYPENRNGKRTVKAYKEIAKAYGQQMALNGLSFDEVRANTVGAWQQYEPNKNITRYDNKEHKNQGFEKLNSQVWSQEVYDSYKETMANQLNQQKQNIMNDYQTQFQKIEDNSKAIEMTIDNLKPQVQESQLSPEEVQRQKDLVEQFAKNRGINVRYDAEAFNGSNEEAKIVDLGNGKREMVINPNADPDAILVKLATHEMFHDTIRTKPHDKLTQLVMDKLKQDNRYQEWRNSVSEAYQEQLQGLNEQQQNALLDEEMTAKYLGEYLGDEQFVQDLVNSTERSTVQRIMDWINNRLEQLKNVVTGNKEAEYWRKVRENFEKAYNSKYVGKEGQFYNINETTDNQGRALTKEQQEYFKDSKVRDANGNLMVVYHGTPIKERFTTFDRNKAGSNVQADFDGIYFTDSQSFGERFAHQQIPTGDSVLSTVRLGERGNLYEGYLNIQNPLNLNNLTEEQLQELYDYVKDEWKDIDPKESFISRWRIMNNGVNAQGIKFDLDLKKVQDAGYDGLIANLGEKNEANGKYVNTGENEYIVFNSNQFKNIDNKNPTSNPDIRYSKKSKFDEDLKKNIETTNNGKNLLALHNLSEDKLRGVLELGGFPVPSIAVTNNPMSNANFGEITVVFNKDTINPELDSRNKVYGRDAYTSRMPDIASKINEKGLKEVSKATGIEEWRLRENFKETTLEKAVDELRTSEEILDKYLKEKGIEVKPVYRDFKGLSSLNQDSLQKFINEHPDLLNLNYTDQQTYSTYEKYYNDVHNLFVENLMNDPSSEITRETAENLYKDYPGYNHWNYFIKDLRTVNELNGGQQLDEYATRKAKEKAVDIDSKEYKDFVSNLISPMFEGKYVRNNKEYYTKTSTPRSFEQRYEDYTLENIVKIMNENKGTGQEGSPFGIGIGELAGDASKRFKSIEDIKNNEYLLDTKNKEEYKALLDKYGDEFRDLQSDITKKYGDTDVESIIWRDRGVADAMQNIARKIADGKKISVDSVIKQYNKNNIDVTEKQAQQTIDLLNDISSLPTDYFEAKPQRAVSFDEIDTIVLPSNTSKEIKQALKDRGINYTEYDSSNENARGDILKSLDEYKFNKKATSFDEYLKANNPNRSGATIGDLNRLQSQQKLPTKQTNQLPTQQKQESNKGSFNLSENKTIVDKNGYNTPAKEGTIRLYTNTSIKNLESILNKGLVVDYAKQKEYEGNMTWFETRPDLKGYGGVTIAVDVPLNKNMSKVNDTQYTVYDNIEPENIVFIDKPAFNNLRTSDIENTVQQFGKQKVMDVFEKSKNKHITREELDNILSNISDKIQKTETKEANLPINENTKGERVNWNEIEKPKDNQKFRKHYRSIIESSNTTAQAKAIAKETMGMDTYTPESNKSQIERADKYIEENGVDQALNRLKEHIVENEVEYDGKNKFKNVNADDIALGERLIQYYSKIGDSQKLQEAIQSTAIMGTEAGRAVQVMAMLNHMTPQGQVTWIERSIEKANKELQQKYERKGKTAPQFDFTSEMQQKILNAENQDAMFDAIDEVYEDLGKQVPKTLSEQIDEWRYFAMLANVKTHARNVLGNVAMHGLQRTSDKIAGAIEDIYFRNKPDAERWHTLKPVSQETKQFALNDLKNRDVQSMLGMNEDKYNPQSRLQSARITFKTDAMNNTLGKAFDVNSNALSVEDNVGLKQMYYKALGEYITANNFDVKNMSDAQLQKARNYAVQMAKEATFHQASSLATMLNQLGKKNNLAKFALDAVVPFKKTPINVAKAGVQYSPIGLVKSAVYDLPKLRRGDISANQYINNISRGVTGTGIVFIGYALAEAGILKASGGDDDKKERYEEEQGKQSYSIKIGDKTYSLDWLSPAGIPLFIGAEINEQFNSSKKEKATGGNEDDFQQLQKTVANVFNATANAMNPMSEMSMISGLTSVLSSYNKENAIGDMIVNTGKSYINQYVPTALSQIARTTDEYERTTKSTKTGAVEKAIDQTINQVKSKIPGLRQTLPVKTDVWGEEVKQPENIAERTFNNFINPATVKEISTDKVDTTLNELYDRTGEGSVLPSTINKTFSINGTTYRMTNKEYAEASKNYGKTAHDILNQFVDSKEYKSMSDEQKEKAISEVYKYANELNKYNYAKNNNLDLKTPTDVEAVNEVKKNGGTAVDYFKYKGLTDGMNNNTDKISAIENSSMSDKSKRAVYMGTVGKNDELYQYASELNINEYLKYKTANIEGVKDDNGKTISGSKKQATLDYINNNISGYENRLWLMGENYKLSRSQQQDLAEYIMSANDDEELEIFKLFSNNFTVKDGKVYYK